MDEAVCEQRRGVAGGAGWRPQPLSPLDDGQVARLLGDEAWCLQEEIDGPRVLVSKLGDTVMTFDGQGISIRLPVSILVEVLMVTRDCVLEGVVVEGVYQVFDLLAVDGVDCREQPFRSRLVILACLLGSPPTSVLRPAPTAWGVEAKRYVWDTLRRAECRKLVFRRLDLP